MDAAERSSVPDVGVLVGGRYRITGILGQGGMGLVLAAHDESGGGDVALKLLQSVGDANVERFLREARVAAKIESEHVVQVLDVGSRAGRPFLVMERLRGEDYGTMLRGPAGEPVVKLCPLPLVEVADCVLQTCEALARAHGAGVVHRDVKASNLFAHRRDDQGRIVKVLDFGISKIFAGGHEPERTLTRTSDGGVLGSPPYMSPEHVRDPRAVDNRSDLWSLGVVAYRLLTARYPFPGDSAKEVLAAVVGQRPRRLRDHGVDVPDPVEAIIGRCLAPDREDRYADAGALAAAFAPFASERWRRYGEVVPEIVRRTPAPAMPAAEVGPHAAFDPRALLAEPATCTLAPKAADASPTTEIETGTERADVRQSVTVLMADRPAAAAPAPVSPPAPAEAGASRPRAGREAVRTRSAPRQALALVGVALAALVTVGVGLKSLAKPRPAPMHAPADRSASSPVAPAAPATSSAPPVSSLALVPIAAPPPRSSVGTPPIVPRATRRRAPAAPPPVPSPSQPPKSVLQPNPYAG